MRKILSILALFYLILFVYKNLMAKNRIIPIMTQYKNYEVYNWYIKGKDDTYKNILKKAQKKE